MTASKVSAAITEGLKVEDKRGGDRRSDEFQSDNNVRLKSSEQRERSRNKQAAEGWYEVASCRW